ncbi:M48 family metalloprotease [Actinoplanes regularis]|uniref:Peptidase family M48 n=1 Tax=Actinoplanes regularis TaxID=52697 RepID=A0A239HZG6_9ACTN|nr:M48 family metalloprotease [Actinoplanes regularis]GIE91297.1 hypothetical protein Are01nite_77770 [Actinoplanes regularis]SNS86661.1 Peptidase family M48 [Actinoplanes regularis]
MHLLVLVALTCVGVSAGEAVFVAHDLGRWAEVQDCVAAQGLPSGGGRAAALLGRGADYDRCAAGFDRTRTTARAAGALTVPVLAWLCVLGEGLVTPRRLRRRIRRRAPAADAAAIVTRRFEHWCDVLGLTGRRRPRLVVAPAGRDRQPYTTGVPFGRLTVAVPSGYGYTSEGERDLIILHELAHVRARDVSWTAATGWAGVLVVPVLALAMLPVFLQPALATGSYRRSLLIAAVFAAAALLLRSAARRRRERAADRFAVETGGLAEVLRTVAPAGNPRPRWWPGRLLATHPSGPDRAEAATNPADWEGGFAVAALLGLLTMFGGRALLTLLLNVQGGVLPGIRDEQIVELVTAAAWSAVATIIWVRRTPANRRAWWARVLGSAAGLTAGWLMPSVGSLSLSSVHSDLIEGHEWFFALWVAPAWTGVAAVAAGLAGDLSARPSGWPRAARTIVVVLGLTVAVCAVLETMSLLTIAHWTWADVRADRAMLVGSTGFPRLWAAGALAVAALAATRVTRLRGTLVIMAAALAAGGVVATIAAAQPTGDVYLWLLNRWWMCAIPGWLATAAVLARRGEVSSALLAGAVVTVLGGVVQFARDSTVGGTFRLDRLVDFLDRGGWLWLVLILFTLPVAVLLGDLLARVVRRPRRALVRLGLLTVPLVVAVLAATGAVATGRTGMITGMPDDVKCLGRPVYPEEPDTEPRACVEDPGRPLPVDRLRAALAEARRSLPAGWTPAAEVNRGDLLSQLSFRCPGRAPEPAAAVAETLTVPGSALPPLGSPLTLGLASYPSTGGAHQARLSADASARACPEWTFPERLAEGGRWRIATSGGTDLALPYPLSFTRVTATARIIGLPARVVAASVAVEIGHNLVTVALQHSAPPDGSVLPQEQNQLLDGLLLRTVWLIIHALQE